MKSVITIASLCIFLGGCGGGAGYVSTQAKHPYDIAWGNHDACIASIDTSLPAGVNDFLLWGYDDPDRLRKSTLQVQIEQDYKDYLLMFDSQYVR